MHALIPRLQARAPALDQAAAFPADDLRDLTEAGLLLAPLPAAPGGLGAGTETEGASLLRQLLILCARGNPSVARLFEAHVNAIRLVHRFGTAEQARLMAQDALSGHLFGLWVTDAPGQQVRIASAHLRGRKGPCSGAGHCTRALITAESAGATRLVMIALSGHERVDPVSGLHGMRAAANGTVTLDGVPAPDSAIIGEPGDYLREPDFSCGAWRSSAAALGTLEALIESAQLQLRRRGYAAAPLQQARFGEVLIAQETARLWVERASGIAESQGDPPAQVAYVNLARIAVEAACLDAMRHVQRSLGLAAFVAPNPVELLSRDLATYLRQPAPDEVLTEAASYYLAQTPC